MKTFSSIIITATTLLLTSSVSADNTRYGQPNTNPHGDCTRKDSFPQDPSTPYWEYGPCDPYYTSRKYCEKGCIVNNGYGGDHYEVVQQTSRRRLGGNNYNSNHFTKYPDHGCRNNHGDKGSDKYEYDLYKNISRDACEKKCKDNYKGKCYGYEYHKSSSTCEVWKVPIYFDLYQTKKVHGLDCYVKGEGNNNNHNNLCESGCIVW